MRRYRIKALIVSLLLFQAWNYSCTGRKEYTKKEYSRWINDPTHGLIAERQVNDLKLTVKYLPPEYLASRESQGLSQSAKDSLTKIYSESKTFLLTIGPSGKEEKKGDLMFRNISNYQQYKERSYAMNFEMEDYVSLSAENEIYRPVLFTLENTYGLEEGRSVYLVFNDEKKGEKLNTAKELDIVFNDELFETGLSHFTFSKKDIDRLPHLIF